VELLIEHNCTQEASSFFQDEKAQCEEGVTFGCNDNHTLFVEDGCDANFTLTGSNAEKCHVRCAAAPGSRSVCSCGGKEIVDRDESLRELVGLREGQTSDAAKTYIVSFESVPLLEAANLTSRRVGKVYAGQMLEILEFSVTVTVEDVMVHWTLGRIKSPPSWIPLRRVAETMEVADEKEHLPFGQDEAEEAIEALGGNAAEQQELRHRLAVLMAPPPHEVITYAVPLSRSLQAGPWPPEGISHVRLHFKPLETDVAASWMVEEMAKDRGLTQHNVDKGDESMFALKQDGEDPTQRLQLVDFEDTKIDF